MGKNGRLKKADVWSPKELADIREIYSRYTGGEPVVSITNDFYETHRRTANGKLWAKRIKANPKSKYVILGYKGSPVRIYRALKWYRRMKELGIEPEMLDPTSGVFSELESVVPEPDVVAAARWKEYVQALPEE